MKIKKEFELRNVCGEHTLVPVGDTATTFKGLITINNIGHFIWDNLEKVDTEEEIVSMIVDKYKLDPNKAKSDVDDFLKYLRNVDII